jgi:hypothetical protein
VGDDDDFDVLADGVVVGRIFKVHAAPVGTPWMWTLAFGHHEDRTPTHGYEATREAAMAAFRQELAAGVAWLRKNSGRRAGPPASGASLPKAATSTIPICFITAATPRKDGLGERNHARDRSCFAQYRNNGFTAHRR